MANDIISTHRRAAWAVSYVAGRLLRYTVLAFANHQAHAIAGTPGVIGMCLIFLAAEAFGALEEATK